VNRQILHLFSLIIVLFAVLVVFTSRWTVFEQESLEENSANRRPLLEQLRIPRGDILARDGTVLAHSVSSGSGSRKVYSRTYPEDGLFAHALGYSYIDRGQTGLELSRNDELTGEKNEFVSLFDELLSRSQEGEDVHTTLDPEAQQEAIAALGGQTGSVVALEPATGRVRVMVSVPDFDPNAIPDQFSELNQAEGSPIFNRATQARYPPGSTMKVVAAAAALDSGEYEPDSIVSGESPKTISGAPLTNSGGADFGPIPLTTALTNSVNTVWAEVGEELGSETMYEYMERFGFNTEPDMDYPRNQMTPSGVFDENGDLLDQNDPVDIGRVAIGQERLQVTPLQMAMVAAAVGNGGVLMKPRLTDRVVDKDGRVTERIDPEEEDRVIEEDTATALADMMADVVNEGTGTAAALSGIQVAGKTGTAEVDSGASNQAWFIAFAPVDDPQMAIAVTVERTTGQGGTVAAPIAKRVLETLLG
jgi:peptidoglycan glycosyltransferase